MLNITALAVPLRRICKVEILPVDDEGFDTALGKVIAELKPPVVQVFRQLPAIIVEISQRIADFDFLDAVRVEPHAKNASRIGFFTSRCRFCFRFFWRKPFKRAIQLEELLTVSLSFY